MRKITNTNEITTATAEEWFSKFCTVEKKKEERTKIKHSLKGGAQVIELVGRKPTKIQEI